MNWSDGRISKSLLNFLQILKQKGVEVFFFDNYAGDYNPDELSKDELARAAKKYELERDREMARQILANYNQKPTLIIAGNYHTESQREESMANFLEKETNQTLPNISLEYGKGEHYNFGRGPLFDRSEEINIPILIHSSDSDFRLQIPVASPVEVFQQS